MVDALTVKIREQPGGERARPAGVSAWAGRGDRIGPARRVQADAAAVHAQFGRVVAVLADRYPDAAEHLDDARADLLAFTAYPWPESQILKSVGRLLRRRTRADAAMPEGSGASILH